uniref:Uncharacterized protein n=1 Tax=Caldisericum exile TaxID=693075 RepID=A0A7C4U120_9BACT
MTTIIEMIINGIFIGFGTTIGTYLGTKFTQMMIEKQLEEIRKLLEQKKKLSKPSLKSLSWTTTKNLEAR